MLNTYPQTGLVMAARLGLALVVITSYPLQAFAFRTSIGTFGAFAAVMMRGVTGRRDSAVTTPCRWSAGPLLHSSMSQSSALEPTSPPVRPQQPKPQSQPSSPGGVDNAYGGWLSRHFALDIPSVLTTLVLLLGTTIVALNVTDLGKALQIGGALMGNILTFVAPGLIYTLLARKNSLELAPRHLRIIALMMLWLGIALVPVTVTASLLD